MPSFSVISIFLFAVVFAPTSMFHQAFSMMGFLDGGAQSKDAKSEIKTHTIQGDLDESDEENKQSDDDDDNLVVFI